jgi:signal transduction histidine kinase
MAGLSALSASGLRRLLWPVSVALATIAATVAGLLVAVLVHGQLPSGDAIVPVTTGTIVAVVIGVLVAPALRDSIRSAVPALRRAPSEITRRIAENASQRLPFDELLRRAAEAMRTGLDSVRVEIWLTSPTAGLTRQVTLGVTDDAPTFTPRDRTVISRIGVAGEGWAQRWVPQLVGTSDSRDSRRTPLRVGAITDSGELLGMVVVGRRAGAPHYDFEDDDSLAAACRLLAAIVRNRQLTFALEESLADLQVTNEELQRSRTRIVTAADAERRRIERNLHDGAQQHLVALAVKLGLARSIAEDGDTETVLGLLEDLRADVQTTIGELRELAHGIYPPLLRDRGLGEALRTAATRSPLPCSVDVDLPGRYAEEIETAAYFCCLEAMQNAGKYAGEGASITVRLHGSTDVLCCELSDDGAGFDASTASLGHGFLNMKDRLGAIGGELSVESTPGRGTVVRASIPAQPIEAAAP